MIAGAIKFILTNCSLSFLVLGLMCAGNGSEPKLLPG